MSVATLFISIAFALGMAQCKQVSFVEGIAVGVEVYLPMLFLLWLPYLGVKFVLELSRAINPTAVRSEGGNG